MMKRANTWRDVDDFDFGNEGDDDEFRKVDVYATTTKRNRKPRQDNVGAEKSNAKTTIGKRRKFEDDTLDWIARHRPTAPSQLAVNQKKVEEFAEWARGKQVGWICF